MKNNIKLTVIVPVYNAGKYLRNCIESLVNQSLLEMEVIFVNDCSPCIDDEYIIKEYLDKDSRLVYLKHDVNKGTAGAINTGLKHSRGKYVTIVGNDDYLLEDCYKYLCGIAEKNNVNVLGFGAYSFEDGKDDIKTQIYKNSYYRKARKVVAKHFPSEVTWNKLIKLEDIKKYKLEFNENAKYEDIEFWYRYVITVDPVMLYVNKNYYMYRQRANSVMSNFSNYTQRFNVYKMIYNFIKKYNKEDEYRKNIIQWLNFPENFDLFDEAVKEVYRKELVCFMKEISISSEEIFKYLDMRIFKIFIKDTYVCDKYSEIIDNYKAIKYKYFKINVFAYKVKREFKRIFRNIR